MFFRNALPLLKLLEGLRVVFLTPLPRYLQEGCCEADDHAPNRFDDGFEAGLRKGLMEIRGYFKDFLFTNNLRFKILTQVCVCPLLTHPETLSGVRTPSTPSTAAMTPSWTPCCTRWPTCAPAASGRVTISPPRLRSRVLKWGDLAGRNPGRRRL
jgi:hypothetical protein